MFLVHAARLARAAAVSTDAGGGGHSKDPETGAREWPSCQGARAFIRKDGLFANGAAAMGSEPGPKPRVSAKTTDCTLNAHHGTTKLLGKTNLQDLVLGGKLPVMT